MEYIEGSRAKFPSQTKTIWAHSDLSTHRLYALRTAPDLWSMPLSSPTAQLGSDNRILMSAPHLKVDGSVLEIYNKMWRSVAGAARVTERMIFAGFLLQDGKVLGMLFFSFSDADLRFA